jgi:hypothetical protein
LHFPLHTFGVRVRVAVRVRIRVGVGVRVRVMCGEDKIAFPAQLNVHLSCLHAIIRATCKSDV